MSDSVNDLVNAIISGNALETENAFAAAMAEKVSAKLDDMRMNVAQSMFSSPAVELENEEVPAE